jgi:LysM repeat protein
MASMLERLRQLLEHFWAWLDGELPGAEAGAAIQPGPGQFVYTVQPGDTLSGIARRFSTSAWILADLNDLDAPSSIRAGRRLLIPRPGAPVSAPAPHPGPGAEPPPETEPGPFLYLVRSGDTLSAIAGRFGVAAAALAETNYLQEPDLIRPGQRLLIPGPQTGLEPSPPPGAPPAPEPLAPTAEPGSLPMPEPAALPHPPGTPPSPIAWPTGAVRAVYVSYTALGDRGQRHHVIDLLARTEINALVIDVKGDQGLISYPTSVPLAHDIGAARPAAPDFYELMDFFKANRIHTIARMVTFKDPPLAQAHPEWAAQRAGGGAWHDRAGLAWSDPFVQAVWEYNADLAEEAARRGFDEIQFDYVRFPTSGQPGSPAFSQPLSRATRVAAITAFLSYVRGRLAPLGVRIAADVSGYTCWRQDDALIGQEIERMAPYLDVLCPLLYPSSFTGGIPGYPNAIAHPYQIVYESTQRAVQRVKALNCHVRPWIQDFPDHHFDRRSYAPAEIRAQIQASFDAGGSGYMAWDPDTTYTAEAYRPEPEPVRA